MALRRLVLSLTLCALLAGPTTAVAAEARDREEAAEARWSDVRILGFGGIGGELIRLLGWIALGDEAPPPPPPPPPTEPRPANGPQIDPNG